MADPFAQAEQQYKAAAGGGGGGSQGADPFGAALTKYKQDKTPSMWDKAVAAGKTMLGATAKMGQDLLEGAGAGAMSTIYHGGDLLRRMTGSERIINNPEVQRTMQANGPVQQVGKAGEQMLEAIYAPVPFVGRLRGAAAVAKSPMARVGLRAGAEALQAGGATAVQTGADPKSTALATAAGGATGAVTQGIGEVQRRVADLTSTQNPVRAAAARAFERHGGEVDPATRTGSPFLQQAKKFLSSGPKATTAQDLSRRQGEQYAAWGEDILNRAAGNRGVIPATAAADKTVEGVNNLSQQYAELADQGYNGFRAASRILQQPITVDRTPVRNELQPIYDYLKRTLSATQKEMSPAYKTLEDIMETGSTKTVGTPGRTITSQTTRTVTPAPKGTSPTQVNVRQGTNVYPNGGPPQVGPSFSSTSQYTNPGVKVTNTQRNIPGTLRTVPAGGPNSVDIETALADLHMLWEQAKLEGGEIARNLTKGIGAKAYQAYRQAVDDAVRAVNPHLLDALNAGRIATARKYATLGLMRGLGVKGVGQGGELIYEPMTVFDRLTRSRDASVNLLQQLGRSSPDEIRRVGAAYLEGLMSKASRGGAEASFSRGAGVLNDWNNLGPQTKQALFGTNLTRELDDFFRMGEYLAQNPNPSGTGMAMTMAARLLAMAKHPIWAAKEAGLEYALGKYLFSTNGPLAYAKMGAGWSAGAQAITSAFRQVTGRDPKEFQGQTQGQTAMGGSPDEPQPTPSSPMADNGSGASPFDSIQLGPAGGNRPTRNNNPGNIKASSYTRQFPGVVGEDEKEAEDGGKFLKFDSPKSGLLAIGKLLESPIYVGMTAAEAIATYNHNGTYGAEDLGLDPNADFQSQLRRVGPQQIALAIAKREGFDASNLILD